MDEVATALDARSNTVKSWLARGRAALAKDLRDSEAIPQFSIRPSDIPEGRILVVTPSEQFRAPSDTSHRLRRAPPPSTPTPIEFRRGV
ncbi:hypothetical protein [Asanoa siamensis]|uniref:hypothetical protein n=1 Tax=Asanoa siamensis TaxID=926357 RepID=UPI003570AC85